MVVNATPKASAAINVLVVDNNKVNRTRLRHHLQRLKLSFLEAADDREAVECMQQHDTGGDIGQGPFHCQANAKTDGRKDRGKACRRHPAVTKDRDEGTGQDEPARNLAKEDGKCLVYLRLA